MNLTFEKASARENFLKKNFSRLKKDREYISRFYYGLGRDWFKLGDFKKAKRYFWQAFLSWPLRRIDCLFEIIGVNIEAGQYGYTALRRNSALKKIIKNQRVLIIGSGTSANELKYIPSDVKILTCNVGPRILLYKGINKVIDLYYCVPGVIEGDHKNENVIDLVLRFKINLFIYPAKWIKSFIDIKKTCVKCIKDHGFNDYYLNKIMGPLKTEEIKRSFLSNNRTSSGVRLLQYALYSQAKEIFLLGIDINEEGYFWGRKNIHEHLSIDKDFIEFVSHKYNNIYSASRKSPIMRYVKYKPLL
ncbi:MAG: hypothetical protein A2166_05440 [Omnitrophica WOR_2 bacterium RBG_13_41_10]|nr:MAG: hypothetical protein A2166_05440 [Omnitrophica WOR_2 bacterium RBG_13_41_10]